MKKRLWLAYVGIAGKLEKLRRAWSPRRLNFVHYGWPLRASVCPCDVQFCDYLRDHGVRGRSVFHFGSGAHHLVGERNLADGLGNEVLAITLAPAELRAYMRRVIATPALGRNYKVLFADIYSLGNASLPRFDVATLFHLGEFGDPQSDGRRLDDEGVLALLIDRVAQGGELLFYRGSFAFAKIHPIIERAVARGALQLHAEVGELLVYRRA